MQAYNILSYAVKKGSKALIPLRHLESICGQVGLVRDIFK